MKKIVIIGNGISGVSTARWIRKLSPPEDYHISLISHESEYFFSRTALMYVYMGHMRWKDIQPYENDFWTKNQIQRIQNLITTIDFGQKTLKCKNGDTIAYDILVLATGSVSATFNWPGQNLHGVAGLYSKQDLEFIESLSHDINHAVIVGGGLIGIELAEMFHSRSISVTLLVRESQYWSTILPYEEACMISRHIRQHNMDLRLNCELKEILWDDNSKVIGVKTKSEEDIACQFVGLTTGVRPNIDFLKNTALECDKGILVNEFLETNIPDVYAIGDCAQLRQPSPGRRAIEAVWYTGRKMGETLANSICRQPTIYNPGIWFNSAKFLDIEYQVYGTVPSIIKMPLHSFYWEHENGKKSIRLVFDIDTSAIRGFNLMGIRFRQEVCEKWIHDETLIDDVMANIRLAFFDPEFFEDVSIKFLDAYNQEFSKSIKLHSKNSLNAVLQFFKTTKSNR
jgi:3-phenylpropionate/trans-cinnamate dioxygenase ferredoxin reductase component